MDQRPLVEGHICNFGISIDIFEFFKKIWFLGILGPPRNHASRWIRDLWSKGMSLILAYFQMFLSFCVLDDFFPFFKKIGFWGILCPTKHDGNHASRWIRDFWSKGVSLILSYFQTFLSFCVFGEFFRFSKNLVFGYSWSTLLWHRCYYPHRSRDALSPVCGIFCGFFLHLFDESVIEALFIHFSSE